MNGRRNIFTYEERKQIESLLKMGVVLKGIARAMGTNYSVIQREISLNGNRSNYSADEAQKRADEKEALRKKGIYTPLPPPRKNILSQRIDNLEMQLEIIIDQIKDLQNAKNN